MKELAAVLMLFSCLKPCLAGEQEKIRAGAAGFGGHLREFGAEVPGAPMPQNKELLSDFHIRYVIKGGLDLSVKPPVFTAETGQRFKVVKYPRRLKEAAYAGICVEGHVRQRDAASELAIEKALPPDSPACLAQPPETAGLQRDPVLLERGDTGYVLGNVAWGMAHDAAGALTRDMNGNPVTDWQSGVKVDPSLLEDVYFVKKMALKPVRYGDHGMLLFRFAAGGVIAGNGARTSALAVSLDAYYADQDEMSYSPVEALRGKYQVYYSVQTGERYSDLKFNYNEFNLPTELELKLYPLLLDGEQKIRLLQNAVAKAAANNKGEMYSLFNNSCANSALSLINSVLTEERKIRGEGLRESFYRIGSTFPDALSAILVKRGLAGRPLPAVVRENYRGYFASGCFR